MKSFLIVIACTLAAGPAHAIEVIAKVETIHEDTSPLVGNWPEKTPAISLEVDHDTLRDAIEQIADQAGWGLVFTAPEADADRFIADAQAILNMLNGE